MNFVVLSVARSERYFGATHRGYIVANKTQHQLQLRLLLTLLKRRVVSYLLMDYLADDQTPDNDAP